MTEMILPKVYFVKTSYIVGAMGLLSIQTSPRSRTV